MQVGQENNVFDCSTLFCEDGDQYLWPQPVLEAVSAALCGWAPANQVPCCAKWVQQRHSSLVSPARALV